MAEQGKLIAVELALFLLAGDSLTRYASHLSIENGDRVDCASLEKGADACNCGLNEVLQEYYGKRVSVKVALSGSPTPEKRVVLKERRVRPVTIEGKAYYVDSINEYGCPICAAPYDENGHIGRHEEGCGNAPQRVQ